MSSWFHKTFGFAELTGSQFSQTCAAFTYRDGKLSSSYRPERLFTAGTFITPTLAELRGRLPQRPATLDGVLSVKEVLGDVSAFHVDPDNAGALFQCASQFNCLEHTSEQGAPEEGITIYSSDRTQGPACAIACAPGTVVRNYFGVKGESQTRNRQVENLKDVEDVLKNKTERFFEVKSGYTMASSTDLERLCQALASDDMKEHVRQKLRIGIQEDTEVTCSGFGKKMHDCPEQIVTQAYCSAISVAYSGCSPELWKPFAKCILEGAYEATMIAAIENAIRNPGKRGCKKVFLTALGGGVFGNDMQWIHDAMKSSFDKFQSWNLEVYLVSYGSNEKIFQELERHAKTYVEHDSSRQDCPCSVS
eukprot:TRINITY_DN15986_c0_g1_i1.p1 TRINITY_DN15986_c0_g1~~TRINITY_DN15986_c0_g1_i1.p1  ORF type:complete len:363 (+),score=29.97 TRINITY_DN15986_c0_g1_i1:433-1521(+)